MWKLRSEWGNRPNLERRVHQCYYGIIMNILITLMYRSVHWWNEYAKTCRYYSRFVLIICVINIEIAKNRIEGGVFYDTDPHTHKNVNKMSWSNPNPSYLFLLTTIHCQVHLIKTEVHRPPNPVHKSYPSSLYTTNDNNNFLYVVW